MHIRKVQISQIHLGRRFGEQHLGAKRELFSSPLISGGLLMTVRPQSHPSSRTMHPLAVVTNRSTPKLGLRSSSFSAPVNILQHNTEPRQSPQWAIFCAVFIFIPIMMGQSPQSL